MPVPAYLDAIVLPCVTPLPAFFEQDTAMGFWRDLLHAGGTGGLNWHVHAHGSLTRWQPTIELIDGFLAQVQPRTRHLLLLGGSAGWMMPRNWLARFETIDAYDIDPMAAWLFNWRHGKLLREQGISVVHHRMDALANLSEVLVKHPEACVWFDNVLGQHRYRLRDEARVERELSALKHTLHGRSWGSLHDWLSGPTHPHRTPSSLNALLRTGLTPALINETLTQQLLQEVGAHTAWSDHLTQVVFPADTPIQLMPWSFKPNYWHWLQAGWVSA